MFISKNKKITIIPKDIPWFSHAKPNKQKHQTNQYLGGLGRSAIYLKNLEIYYDKLISEGYSIQEIDVDEQPELAKEFNVRGVPTLVVNGNSIVGYRDKSQIKEAVGG